MSNIVTIKYTDSNGLQCIEVKPPTTICITWAAGRIGTIVIEDFRLGTKYSTKATEFSDDELDVGGMSKAGPIVAGSPIPRNAIGKALGFEVSSKNSNPTSIKSDKIHILPAGGGTYEVWY